MSLSLLPIPDSSLCRFTRLCQALKSNAAAALTHYLFYASSLPASGICVFCLILTCPQISSKGDKSQAVKELKCVLFPCCGARCLTLAKASRRRYLAAL
jgi:hypothetical protein